MNSTLTDLVVQEVNRHLVVDGINRIQKCLSFLSEEEVWFKRKEDLPSVGNLLLHLNGNVTQWILSTWTAFPDNRQRELEFSEVKQPTKKELIELLQATFLEVELVLDRLTTEDLLETYSVQTFEETGVAILIHVTEHFSYHVGQITRMVKEMKGVDTEYYAGVELG